MKPEVLVILWAVSVTASGVGYEQIQHRLDRLVASVSKNEKTLEQLAANVVETNSRFMEVMYNLTNIFSQSMDIVAQHHKTPYSPIEPYDSEEAYNPRRIPETQTITSCKTPSSSGVFKLKFPARSVYCEMETLGGGWLVIQQRIEDVNLNFNRSWSEYRSGFGVVGRDEDFWLGNEAIHQITSSGEYELAIEFKSQYGIYYYARYSEFHVAGEGDKYRLTVGGAVGTLRDHFLANDDMKFSTYDSNNGNDSSRNCAKNWGNGGGWWYRNCGRGNLNDRNRPYWDYYGYGTYSRMMIRKK